MLQKDLLLPHKTVIDNVALPLVLKGASRSEARERAEGLFELFGLSGVEGRWPAELSGGQRQRAALMRSYLFSHEFMLLDEPFSALDAFTKAELHTWFLSVMDACGASALVVTHDIDEAVKIGDVIFVMRGAPQRRPRPHRRLRARLVPAPKARRVCRLPGVFGAQAPCARAPAVIGKVFRTPSLPDIRLAELSCSLHTITRS